MCLVISDLDKGQVKTLTALLERNAVAYDIASYRDAPAGLRIWCGPTVETADVKALCEWIAYAHDKVKSGEIKKMKIIVTDGLAAGAIKTLEEAGHEVRGSPCGGGAVGLAVWAFEEEDAGVVGGDARERRAARHRSVLRAGRWPADRGGG